MLRSLLTRGNLKGRHPGGEVGAQNAMANSRKLEKEARANDMYAEDTSDVSDQELLEVPQREFASEAFHGVCDCSSDAEDEDVGHGALSDSDSDTEASEADTEDDGDAGGKIQWSKAKLDKIRDGLHHSNSSASFLRNLMRIPKDALTDALGGNIYRALAMGTLRGPRWPWGHGAMPKDIIMQDAQFIGGLTVVAIQVLGPAFLMRGLYCTWEEDDTALVLYWSKWDISVMHWHQNIFTKFLALLFILVFNLNGLFLIQEEAENARKLRWIWRALDFDDKKGTCHFMMTVGSIINCYMVIVCSLCIPVVLGGSSNPKEVLFDSLAIFFLYNLDDVGSDLGFVNAELWPATRFGWVANQVDTPGGDWHKKSKKAESNQVWIRQFGDSLSRHVHTFTGLFVTLVMLVSPILFSVTDFECLKMAPGNYTELCAWRRNQTNN